MSRHRADTSQTPRRHWRFADEIAAGIGSGRFKPGERLRPQCELRELRELRELCELRELSAMFEVLEVRTFIAPGIAEATAGSIDRDAMRAWRECWWR